MKIISYSTLNTLALESFVDSVQPRTAVDDFEFMGAMWSGQCLGFTQWLSLRNYPNIKSISLDFNSLSEASLNTILNALKLNVSKGMTKESILAMFGQPNEMEKFVSDRVTYNYLIGSDEKYYLSLTIHQTHDLIYLVLMNHAPSIKSIAGKTTQVS